MELQEIEAGSETDKRVAEACGLEIVPMPSHFSFAHDTCWVDEHPRVGRDWKFEPSVDWGDAMAAAESYSLFDGWMLGYSRAHSGWYFQNDEEEPLHGEWGLAESGPLAICRAILFLSGR